MQPEARQGARCREREARQKEKRSTHTQDRQAEMTHAMKPMPKRPPTVETPVFELRRKGYPSNPC